MTTPDPTQNDTTETLTADERRWLESDPEFQKWDVRRKVLRIIDARDARIDQLTEALATAERGRDDARGRILGFLAAWNYGDDDAVNDAVDALSEVTDGAP